MSQKELFKTRLVPAKPGSGYLFEEVIVANESPVVCLGQEFKNEEARREHFTALLREKLKDPEFRKIEGFPIGEDEDILALSDPPYYTACPNPWIGDFIKEWESQKPEKPDGYQYHSKPFAADVKGSRHNPIYKAHTYHTKVPWEALIPYLQHYLPEGGIALDCFSGSGMTGVAAQIECKKNRPIYTLLQDMSPAATFISNCTLRTSISSNRFQKIAKSLLQEASSIFEGSWSQIDKDNQEKKYEVAYYVWSEVLVCPNCSHDTTLWDSGYKDNPQTKELRCPHCGLVENRVKFERMKETYFDHFVSKTRERIKRVPVFASLKYGKKRIKKDLSPEERIHPLPLRGGIDLHPSTGKLLLNKTGLLSTKNKWF